MIQINNILFSDKYSLTKGFIYYFIYSDKWHFDTIYTWINPKNINMVYL